MIDDGINIAVFPELILIEESYNVIRDYLKKTPQDELKLIFCGSQWKKNSNVLFVITGNGNELMKYYKKTPFDYTVNNKVYTESLIPHEDIVEMIDIDSLGRIIPTICKDYLNQSYIGQLKHALHCNFAVVSAYSPSVTAFTTTSSEFSQNSHGISVICNCCEPVIKDRENFNHDIGYISLPMKANTSVKTQENYYCYNSGCSSSCKDNICYAKYELYNNSILTDGLNKSIKVEQSIVKIPL